jgi:membrane protein
MSARAGVRPGRWASLRESPSLLIDAARAAARDGAPVFASAVAYSVFLALPATLLLAVGTFSLFADAGLVEDVVDRLGGVVPDEVASLVRDSLLRLEGRSSSGVLMTVVGLVIAIWTATGAVSALMTAVNRAYDLEDTRGFVRKRLVAVALVGTLGFAFVLVAILLVVGSHLQRWIGEALDAEAAVSWSWSVARWPVLVLVLFAAFSTLYALATARDVRRWQVLSPGALIAVVAWLGGSYAFGLYAANLGRYDAAWGSLSTVIVTLVWLWLSALALMFGAEVNAAAERASSAPRRSVR